MKYLECPDLHFGMKWKDYFIAIGLKIKQTAIENNVDFIALPGDLFNKPIYATDSGGINFLRNIIKIWLEVCPVVAIEGTPSHDGPGCYGPLEDLGLTLLKPGKTYGYHFSKNGIKNIQQIDPYISESIIFEPDAILFGVPELNKSTIQADLSMSADEANAKAINLFEQYIEQYVAPMRLKYKDLPAVMLLHGVVSDSSKDHTTDKIIKASDIVIHTDILAKAKLDRVSLGHFHKPWESEKISAGYSGFTGMDDKPWGATGFFPGMNLVSINDSIVKIDRVLYGTPSRVKITQALKEYDPAIAYWLVSDNPEDVRPDGHEWSRITYAEQKTESKRVSAEDLGEDYSLRQLFKSIDPEVTEEVLKRVDKIEVDRSDRSDRLDIKMSYLKISGCDFFDGKTIELDYYDLNRGLTEIRGGNGSGKSSLLSFCSMFPYTIGKIPRSGRRSAISSFFSGKDSMIEKIGYVNGVKHRHVITIRGAHTQSPKTECYIYIDGETILEKTSFDSMAEKCEELYGSFHEYFLTSFYVQPLQNTKDNTGLMTATATEIQALVQSISGIDRDEEKRRALDKVAEIEKEIESKTILISGIESVQIDPDEAQNRINYNEAIIKSESSYLAAEEKAQRELSAVLDKRKAEKVLNDSEIEKKQDNHGKQTGRNLDRIRYAEIIKSSNELIKDLPSLRNQIKQADSQDLETVTAEKIKRANRDLVHSYEVALFDWKRELGTMKENAKRANREAEIEYNNKLQSYVNENKNLVDKEITFKEMIKALNIPCEECGHIQADAAAKIKDYNNEIANLKSEIESMIKPTEPEAIPIPASLDEPAPAYPDIEPEPELFHIEINRQAVQAKIELAVSAEAQIKAAGDRLKEIEIELAELKVKKFNILEDADEKLNEAVEAVDINSCNINLIKETLEASRRIISAESDRLKSYLENNKKIEDSKAEIADQASELADWKYIAVNLQANKVPALELELSAENIDAEATRNIYPYYEGRYTFQTLTQHQGKKQTVDKFDIMVTDCETGKEKSFLEFSPGVKAFLNDAYSKALIRQRNQRSSISYSPIIMDETDGPIEPDMIGSFYEMQEAYWKSEKVLIVTHTPTGQEHIKNKIEIEEIKHE